MTKRHTDTVYNSSTVYSMTAIPSHSAAGQIMPMRYPINLKQIRLAQKLTQGRLAEMIGVEQATIQRWESGSRKPDFEQIGSVADALGVLPGDLFLLPNITPLGPRLFVKGAIAAGNWVEAFEYPEDDWLEFTGRANITANTEHRFGLLVQGDSMNEIYPHGTIVECVSLFGTAEAQPGKRVIVVRQRDTLEYEATVKELVQRDGKMWLVPRSNNPAFQRPISLDDPEPGIISTVIAAVVVSSIRPE